MSSSLPKPNRHEILHYSAYVALYVGHVVRYVLIGDLYNAARSAALANGSLERATNYELPEDWNGFAEGADDARV